MISNARQHAYLLMHPVHQESNYSSWQQAAFSLAVGRQRNDAKSGFSAVFPTIERDTWLKISVGLYTITQCLLTLFYCKFLFTSRGSSPCPLLSIKWAVPSIGARSYGTRPQVEKWKEGASPKQPPPSVTPPVLLGSGTGKENVGWF